MNFVQNNTTIEVHQGILVKREDLCCPFPGPSFSKIRGAAAHIQKRGEPVIGVLDTFHSKAGWGVAYICQQLGKRCVVFWPKYKGDGEDLREQQKQAQELGAELVALPAGRSAILYHQARKKLAELSNGTGYLMPNALKLPESIEETALESSRTFKDQSPDNLIISVSSGTIAAGVLAGVPGPLFREKDMTVWLHMGYDRSEKELMDYVTRGAGLPDGRQIRVVNEMYAYKEKARDPVPVEFPCNPYYDLKAWTWMMKTRPQFQGSILFWNVGA